MDAPDYTEYTLDQLREARQSLDENRYADRATILDLLIRDREKQRHLAPSKLTDGSNQEPSEPSSVGNRIKGWLSGGSGLTTIGEMAGLPSFFGVRPDMRVHAVRHNDNNEPCVAIELIYWVGLNYHTSIAIFPVERTDEIVALLRSAQQESGASS